MRFEDIENETLAKKILKQKVYLPKELIPKTDELEITEKKLIGYTVFDIKYGELGKISYINSQTSQQLIYVEKDSIEFCFPMHEEFVKGIDPKKGVMKVKIPEELLDLN